MKIKEITCGLVFVIIMRTILEKTTQQKGTCIQCLCFDFLLGVEKKRNF